MIFTLSRAQDSQFLFDPNGNLFSQTEANSALPQILGQPQDRIVAPGEATSFSVVAADTRALNYEWRFNGTNISGATNDAVLLQNVSTNNEGPYDVVLTNPSGSVTSAPAMLWIDSDADGMADSFELTYFGTLTNTATADFDGDGLSNSQEFRDGTNPTNSASGLYRLTVERDGGSVAIVPDQPTYTNGQIVTLTASASSTETFRAWLGDIVTRTNPVSVVMTSNKTVSARFLPLVFTWTNFAGGDWNIATNWSPNLVPGSNDNVVISGLVLTGPGSFTVTLDTSADCAAVTLDTGLSRMPILTGSGTLTVWESLLWKGGTMSGTGRTVIESGATLTLDMEDALPGTGPVLNTRTLELGGETFWATAGNVILNNAVITNRAGAVFQAFASGAINQSGGASRFDNAGTFHRFAGTTTFGSGLSVNNYGLMEAEAGGTNRLVGGGSASGTFNVVAGALVEWTGGTFTLNPGAQLNGAGLYNLNGGNVNCDADLTVPNLDLVNIVSTLGGTGVVTVSSLMTWTAGIMSGTGRTIIAPGATFNLANAVIPSQINLVTRTLENAGIALWTKSDGSLALNNSVITNRPGGLFHAQGAAAIGFLGGSPRFDNAGTFRKSVNTGTTTISSGVGFNNSGGMEIQTGTLLVNGSFTNSGTVDLLAGTTNRLAAGGVSSGSFNAAAGALMEWTAGTFTLIPGAQLNGAGLYKLNSGNVTCDATLTVANLDLVHSSSTFSGTGMVTIGSGMNWTAGTMSGTGRTIIDSVATFNVANAVIPSQVNLVNRTLENAGTVLWTKSDGSIALNNSVITNRPGSLFHALATGTIGVLGGSPRFDNAGTFRKSASTGNSTVANGVNFTNYGTVDIRSGKLVMNGNFASTSSAQLNSALGGTNAGAGFGQLQVAGTVTLNGGLSVDLLPGFTPTTNDTFTVVTAGARSGTFSTFTYPDNRVSMTLSNSTTAVILTVTNVLPVPQPALLMPEIVGSNALLTWTATSNVTYRLEQVGDGGATNWSALPGDVTTTSNTASKLDALTSSNRLYRVHVLP